MRMPIPFVGGAYQLKSLPMDSQNCVNWYLVLDQTGKNPVALFPFPGLKIWAQGQAAETNVRGMFELNNEMYAVINNQFILFNTNAERQKTLGTLDSSTGRVVIQANDFQIEITNGISLYIYQYVDDNPDETLAVRKKGDFWRMEIADFTITTPVFSGSGIVNDLTPSGTFTKTFPIHYVVIIDSEDFNGRGYDTFKWSSNNETSYTENVPITGEDQNLDNGIIISFTNKTGHKKNDKWVFDVNVDNDFKVPLIPTYQDGYGVYPEQNSKVFGLTKIDDFSNVDPLQKAEASANPDNLVATISIREELWLFCRRTAEIWYDIGGSSFPFERRQNLLIRYGILAPYSLTVDADNTLFWLAESQTGDRVIVMCDGYTPQVISNEGLNNELKSYTNLESAFSFCYEWNGHKFFNIIFPDDDKTWVYDKLTKFWYERKSVLNNVQPSESATREGRWRANCYVFFNGKHLIGDFENGNIYEMSDDVYTENGTMTICERTAQHIQKDLSRMFVNTLQIDIQAGVGLNTGQGETPEAMLRVSRDGGQQYGNELWRSFGKLGANKERARWNRLGYGRVFTFKLRISDPVYRIILNAVADINAVDN